MVSLLQCNHSPTLSLNSSSDRPTPSDHGFDWFDAERLIHEANASAINTWFGSVRRIALSVKSLAPAMAIPLDHYIQQSGVYAEAWFPPRPDVT